MISRLVSPIASEYFLCGRMVEGVLLVKDLGVSFKHHYQTISRSALKNLGFVLKHSRNSRDVGTLRLLYLTLVRPILEFSSVVWAPYTAVHNIISETFQSKFLRFLAQTNLLHLCVIDLICQLWGGGECVLTWCLGPNWGYIFAPDLLSQLNLNVPPRRVRHFPLFRPNFSRTNYMFYSPIHQIMQSLNAVDSLGVDIFHALLPRVRRDISLALVLWRNI